ncbi:hypothetical protein [Nannocystis radixulma]|uniref:Lipoprotein n=1 Tax=Nannocystis radixulma TaxID=2995305 RepID=A0ABT5B8T3_9BACT|nr:hypothetical protein [Nannocystis radixulma]MDC0670530.1 hypothetical protein [Nannocystis radixulma]
MMSRALVVFVAGSALISACQRQPELPGETKDEKKVDPYALVASIETKASSYKDPFPPTTSPPPGMNPRIPRPAINPSEAKISGRTRVEALDRLFFRVPVEWTAGPALPPDGRPSFVLPGPGGEARLEIVRSASPGLEPMAQIRQWRRQFTTASGEPLADDDVRVQEMVRGPLKIDIVDMAGTYVAPVAPDSAERYNDPGYRMLAALTEYLGEVYVFKAVGPALTMAIWEHAFGDFAASMTIDYVP